MVAIGLYFSDLAPVSSPGLLIRTKNYTDRQKSGPIYRSTIGRLSTDISNSYLLTIDQVSTNYWPIHRWSIDQLSAKCRRKVSEVSVNEKLYRPRHIWNDYRPCLDRVSTDYRPLYRPIVDWVLTECRPSIDRPSTECRPTIDRVSTAISTDISVDITHSKQDPKG